MADPKSNPFGFEGLNDGLDLEAFAPKAKVVDRDKAAATREVASEAGFTRRTPSTPPSAASAVPSAPKASVARSPAPAPAEKGRKRRVNITELLGIQDRYPDTERAQLNMLAPVPVVMRWRKLVRETNAPAWEILEQAMDALEAKSPRGGKA
jgi:hypothetical protein